MGAFVYQNKKSLVLILLNKIQKSVWVYIIMLIMVIYLLMEKKYLNLKPQIEMLTFQLNFVFEVYLMNLVLISLKKYF